MILAHSSRELGEISACCHPALSTMAFDVCQDPQAIILCSNVIESAACFELSFSHLEVMMRWLEKRKHCLTASRSLWSPRPPPDHMRLLPPSPPDDDFPPLPPPPKIWNTLLVS